MNITPPKELGYRVKSACSPQVHTVYDHLVRRGSISNMEAQSVHRIRALPRRISDLEEFLRDRSLPWSVKRAWKKDTTGQRYVRYELKPII